MKTTSLLLLSALSLFQSSLLSAAAAPPPPPVEAKEISPGLYLVLGGGGANSVMLTGADATLVVDAKLDIESADAELKVVDGLAKGPLRYLVNTHVHPDHTGGNEAYGKRGVVIISRDETRNILAAGQRGGPPAPAAALPTMTFDGKTPITMHVAGETVVIRPVPAAHTTDNSIVQFTNANVFQIGDIFSTFRYPVIAGGTVQGFIDAVDQVLKLSNEQSRFIPGNGDIENIAALRKWREMLVTVRDSVSALVKKGNTLEQVTAAKPTAAFDAQYGTPERFIPALYQELSGKKQ